MEKTSQVSVEKTLLPALVQCFGIILIGFILGKTKVLRPTEARGLSVFVQYLSLPALIFTTVSTIPFTKVKWEFIAAIFAAKAAIFMCVSLVTMLLTHPINLSKAGIFAITATQSNDFALGYPLIVALYQDTHPEYPSYLYIIAPVQLLILNTVGFFMLEIERAHPPNQGNSHLWQVIKCTFKNPVIVMTILGLIWNLSYGQKVLPIFESILKAFASAFPASALLLVGYTMTVKSEKRSSQISLSVLLLILTKNFILPLILQKFSTFMLRGSPASEIKALSSLGFLYGTIPTAPTAYVFAIQYDTCVNIVSKAVVGSTFFAAPLMFSSASVISLAQMGLQNVNFYLSQTISYMSVVNLICCIWSIIILWAGKRFKSVSFGIIFYLIFAQFVMALGGILLFFSSQNFTPIFYAQYVLVNGGIYATRASAFLLGALLLTIRIRSLCFILRYKKQINNLSTIVCLVLPYLAAASLLLCKNKKIYGPIFQLGFIQVVATFILTFIILAGTIVCLIMHQVYLKKKSTTINEGTRPVYYQNPDLDTSMETCTLPKSSCGDIEDLGYNIRTESDPLLPGTSFDRLCSSNYQCSSTQRMECNIQVAQYEEESSEIGTGLVDDEYFFKHMVLLILICLAMTVSLFVCLWKLVSEDESGIFIELEFLDVILNYSLGIVCFVMFGLETNLLNRITKKLKLNREQTGETENLEESKKVCEMFLTNHYSRCKKDIGELKLINNEYSCIFSVSDLAEWLVNANVIQNTEEVKSFIKYLVKEQLVEKQCNKFKCLDDTDLYAFTNYTLSMSI